LRAPGRPPQLEEIPVRQTQRSVLFGVAALALTACGAVAAPGAGATEAITPAAQASALVPQYGACEKVPTADLGEQPVDAAIARTPELSTLTSLLAGLPELRQTLATQPALTVFAPGNAAFDQLRAALGEKAYNALLADPMRLDGLLSYHVTEKRLAAPQLVEAGKTTQLAYGDVTVGGTPEALALTSTNGTAAHVVCGNVQTANATVFVIDKVLLPTT
jgi:uncharacterized surface protein with fasciclin (FAS1) repeats